MDNLLASDVVSGFSRTVKNDRCVRFNLHGPAEAGHYEEATNI